MWIVAICYMYNVYMLHSDVSECCAGTHNCSELCVELQGRRECRCVDGHELEDDYVTCRGYSMLRIFVV